MPTKAFELFAEIKFDINKATSDLGAIEQRTARAASGIIDKINAIKRASEFRVKLQGIEGVEQTQGVLDKITGQIVSLKTQMQELGAAKAGILGAAGFDPATVQRFSGRAGAPTMMGREISGAGDIAAIDARRNAIISQTTELLQFRQAAESKLNLELVRSAQYEREAAEAESFREAVSRRNANTQRRVASEMSFAVGVTEQFTTAQERQAVFLERVGRAYEFGRIKAETYNRAVAFGSNVGNFQNAIGGAGRFQFAIQQLSFGVQDFLTVYGTTGLRGALNASANNFAQVAAIINPLQGAFYGLAITIASVVIPNLINWGSHSKKSAEGVNTMTEAVNRQRLSLEALRTLRQAGDVSGIRDAASAREGLNSAEKRKREAEDSIRDIDAKINELNARRADFGFPLRREAIGGGDRTEAVMRAMSAMGIGGGRESAGILTGGGTIPGPKEGQEFRLEGDELLLTRKKDADEIKSINEEIKRIEEDRRKHTVDIGVAERDIIALKSKGRALAVDEVLLLDKHIKATDELSKKLLAIEEDRIKKRREATELFRMAGTPEEERGRILRDIDRRAMEDSAKAQADAADKVFEEGDRANQRYIKKREDREKDIAKMSRDLERENMSDRASKIAGIRDQLEDRRKEILEREKDPEERRRLLNLAAGSAERQLATLKPIGGDKLGITGLHDAIQKGLFSGTMEKDMATTAKNTTEQKNLTKDLINEVKNQAAKAG